MYVLEESLARNGLSEKLLDIEKDLEYLISFKCLV